MQLLCLTYRLEGLRKDQEGWRSFHETMLSGLERRNGEIKAKETS